MYKPLVIKWYDRVDVALQLTALESDWLFNEDSLTKRLTDLSEQQFSVEVLAEQWQVLRDDECQKLQVAPEQRGWVREVVLKGVGEPWVYARSVAMQVGLNSEQYDLTNIGSRSLGSILFVDNSFQRTPLEVARYPVELLPSAYQHFNLWGRRSSFINSDLNIIVQEIFLPAFWQSLQAGE